jgi:hypothetical protein
LNPVDRCFKDCFLKPHNIIVFSWIQAGPVKEEKMKKIREERKSRGTEVSNI